MFNGICRFASIILKNNNDSSGLVMIYLLKDKNSAYVAIIKTLHRPHGKNLTIETEKSEQTLFAQIFLSKY